MEYLPIVIGYLCLTLVQSTSITRREATIDTTPMMTQAPVTGDPALVTAKPSEATKIMASTIKRTLRPSTTMAPTKIAPNMQPSMSMAPSTMPPAARPVSTPAPTTTPTESVVNINITVLEPLPNAQTTTTSTIREQGCGDQSDQCAVYGKSVCFDYEPWARDNCACYCGFCPCTVTSAPCFDKLSYCKDYPKEMCIDPAACRFATEMCPAFCGVCKTPAPTTPMPTSAPIVPTTTFKIPVLCVDTIPNCINYGTAPCTDPLFATFANTKCKKYCNKC